MPYYKHKRSGSVRDLDLNLPPNVGEWQPVVVIDPDDPETIDGLWATLHEHLALRSRDNLAHALRQHVSPAPPEPKGLGSVVLDANHLKYVKVAHGPHGWVLANCMTAVMGGDAEVSWRDIDVAEVLSEGVTG